MFHIAHNYLFYINKKEKGEMLEDISAILAELKRRLDYLGECL